MTGSLGWQELLIVMMVLGLLGALPAALIVALTTSGRRYPESFVDRTVTTGLVTATPARRLAGNFLDGLIAAFTLYVGWLIWLAIVAPRGQSPGKALVGTYVLRGDGTVATAGFIWLREFVVKGIGLWFVTILTSGLGIVLSIAGGLWCLWDRDKQCLWDKVVTSYVAFSPGVPLARAVSDVSGDLLKLKQLLDNGVLTPAEYEERRVRLVGRL